MMHGTMNLKFSGNFLRTLLDRLYHIVPVNNVWFTTDKFQINLKQYLIFKFCKSVHRRIIQINHQPDATIFQFIILTFIYSSTCFGRFPAHHQELNYCSGSRPSRPRTQHDCHHDTKVKPEDAIAVIELLMMGGKKPETCWAVIKRQDNKLENCYVWLVIYLNNTLCFQKWYHVSSVYSPYLCSFITHVVW